MYKFFYRTKDFKPNWHSDHQDLTIKEFSGFEGTYSYRKYNLPLFRIPYLSGTKYLIIINTKKLGVLVQYSPLNDKEPSTLVEDIFYMNVRAFSENIDLMDRFLKKPPKWLKELGTEDKQKEYLEEKDLLEILEKFEFKKHDYFEGYKIEFEESQVQ